MTAEDARERLPDLGKARDAASAEVAAITKAAEELRRGEEAPSSSELAKQARDLIALAALGRQLGLQDGHCPLCGTDQDHRSEEHTSELQSLMRISYAVFCLKKKKKNNQ